MKQGELYLRAGVVLVTLFAVGITVSNGWMDSDWGLRIEGALTATGILVPVVAAPVTRKDPSQGDN